MARRTWMAAGQRDRCIKPIRSASATQMPAPARDVAEAGHDDVEDGPMVEAKPLEGGEIEPSNGLDECLDMNRRSR